MRVLITGPQGSGKTTQAKLVAEYLKIPLIDGGEMLRLLASEDSIEGKRVQEALDKGEIAPNDIVAEVIKKRLAELDCQNGFVMDGYPRTLSQKELFDPQFDRVFYLKMSDDLVKERMQKRGRVDDTPELITERLMLYHQLTEPVLSFYESQGILVRINGEDTIERIQQEIKENLNG
jgi:adenylate kinase